MRIFYRIGQNRVGAGGKGSVVGGKGPWGGVEEGGGGGHPQQDQEYCC